MMGAEFFPTSKKWAGEINELGAEESVLQRGKIEVKLPPNAACAYDDDTHTYTVDGNVVPSVTEIASPITAAEYGALNRGLLMSAADRGHRVHEAIETMLLDEELDIETMLLDEELDIETMLLDEDIYNYVASFEYWRQMYRPKVLYTEHQMFGYDYAGTCDLLCVIDGKVTLIDYKTTAKINYKALSVQLAGYDRLLRARGIIVEAYKVLQLKARELDFVYRDVPLDYEWFDALLLHNKRMKQKTERKKKL